jgi:Fic family protein
MNEEQKIALTATRHLAYLVDIGCLERTVAGGRSTRSDSYTQIGN